MNKENENAYLRSLENRSFEEATFSNLTTANFLKEVNKSRAASLDAAKSSEESTEQTIKKLEEIKQYVGKDTMKINNSQESIGTIITREAMIKNMNYARLNASDIALVNCGLNCVLDLTQGSLTNQRQLFSEEDWSKIKALFPKPPNDADLKESRPKLSKIDRVFKNPRDIEECYWNAKMHQKKASRSNEKMGYELISIILDKMTKHKTIFSISKPNPSEADIMIKIWADLFEVLFYNTGIYVRWGEKGLISDDARRVMFKLDAKLVLLYDDEEYPVSCLEFAPYSGIKKINSDRSKLLVEAKTMLNQAMNLKLNEEHEANLKIVNMQIMGLEAHLVSVRLVDDHLYVANSIESYMIPSSASQLKKESKTITGHLFDFKQYTLDTANTIRQTLGDKKKKQKSMKRKMEEDNSEEAAPPSKSKLAPAWRHKAKAEK